MPNLRQRGQIHIADLLHERSDVVDLAQLVGSAVQHFERRHELFDRLETPVILCRTFTGAFVIVPWRHNGFVSASSGQKPSPTAPTNALIGVCAMAT